MVRFRIDQPVRAPPEFVVRWWLDYSSEDVRLTDGLVDRTVTPLDPDRTRLSTTAEFGGRVRTTTGTVTRTGPRTWHMSGHVISSGVTVSTLQTGYTVLPDGRGSRVIADFEFVGRTWSWRLALAVSGYALRRRQRASFQDYAAAIERAFRVGPPAT
ncbi:MAG TPA: hypothetical protein VMC82_02740 [Thermoplasmata archaeon]|nr:hypothetical protein [Thermoplasmata archaeon]